MPIPLIAAIVSGALYVLWPSPPLDQRMAMGGRPRPVETVSQESVPPAPAPVCVEFCGKPVAWE